jgi:hypothetical protein
MTNDKVSQEVDMPSPFPGMDPYLEGSFWTSVHFSLSAEIVRQLAAKLPSNYLVLPAERYVMEIPEGITITQANIYPDVSVAEAESVTSGSSDTVIAPAPLRLATVIPSSIPHVTIEIRDIANRQLVTAIEVLSLTNKRGDGQEEYLTNRQRILLSRAHLLEIDLLRQGQRVPMQQPLPSTPYFVFLSRVETRPITEVWPIALSQSLPIVPVPLLADDPDIPLDLQLTFTTVYDLLRYEQAVDYTRPLEVPLQGEAATWTNKRLQAAKFRD